MLKCTNQEPVSADYLCGILCSSLLGRLRLYSGDGLDVERHKIGISECRLPVLHSVQRSEVWDGVMLKCTN